jgi:hypothetical protein
MKQPNHPFYNLVIKEKKNIYDLIIESNAIELSNFQTRIMSGHDHYFNPIKEYDGEMLNTAKQNLKEGLLFFGLQNRFAESLNLMRSVLGIQLPQFELFNNIGIYSKKMSDHMMDGISKFNQTDIEFYKFIEEQFDILLSKYKVNIIPNIAEPLPSDSFSIESYDKRCFSKEYKYIILNGWALDRKAEDVAHNVFINIDGKNYPVVYGTDRRDVAVNKGNHKYRYCGFQGAIETSKVRPGNHKLKVNVVSKDLQVIYEQQNHFNLFIQ